jgi:hypothetical protein
MDSVLHAIGALPGAGRYAVTFRRPDGSEQTAVIQLDGATGVDVAPASLPQGWTTDGAALLATIEAVRAFDAARRHSPVSASLRDVDGGWDVSLGNVVLGDAGRPTCTAHGAMSGENGTYVCAECGAQAAFG